MQSILNQVIATSEKIHDARTPYQVLAKGMEEIGELAQEVLISSGDHYKEPGKDGIVGEAVDVIICMVDMIYQVDPLVSDKDISKILARKLAKWEEKAELMAANREELM